MGTNRIAATGKHRRRTIALGALLAAIIGLLGSTQENRPWRGDRPLRVAAYQSPPYYFHDHNGTLQGLAVELVQQAAKAQHIAIEWVWLTVPMEQALDSHLVDLVPVVSVTPERQRKWHLTEPWLVSRFTLVSTNGAPRQNLVGMVGLPVTVDFAKRLLPQASRRLYPSRMEAMAAMCAGEVDAVFIEERVLESMLLERPRECAEAKLSANVVEGAQTGMSLGSTRQAARAAEVLREQFTEFALEGKLGPIMDKWSLFSTTETFATLLLKQNERRQRLLLGIGIALLFVTAVFYWLARIAREARRAAVRAAQAKAEFLANMSHEIRTPMHGIIGLTEAVLHSRLESDQREQLEMVRFSAQSLVVVLNDILDYSKMEAGSLRIDQRPFDIRTMLRNVTAGAIVQAESKGLRLHIHVTPQVPERIQGDAVRLGQVLVNLLTNAIKFTDHGQVTLSVDVSQSTLLLSVTDTGIGISPADQTRLFQPFEQVDPSLSRRAAGTGLGLAISRRLVEMMQGRLELASQPGLGSCFTIRLPLLDACAVLEPEPPPVQAPSIGAIHVLVADDNAVNRRVATAWLRKAGWTWAAAADGAEALRLAREQNFDLVLMDVHMPDVDGLEATRQMRSAGMSMPIVALTASAMGEDVNQCLAAGMTAHLAKPYTARDFYAVVAEVLRKPIPS